MLPADRFAWRLASCECDASRVLGISQLWRSQTPVGVSKIDMPRLSVIVSTPGALGCSILPALLSKGGTR